MHRSIDQQVIVITGASSGIGLCTAMAAADAGARVVLAARSLAVLEDTAAAIGAAGGTALAARCDVSRRGDVEAVAQLAQERFGRIDTWVNNAGLSVYGRLEDVSEDDSRRLFDVNFWGVVNGSLAALPFLRRSGGVLVNLGSEVSEAVIPLQGMYSASKHAVKGFTDALRVEQERVDGSPVSIVLVQPSAVDTPFPQHARNYMAEEPKLPSPLIDPARVAAAILHAATHGGRDETVGAMAVVNTAMSHLMPQLADRMSAMQARRQQADAPALDRSGTLHRPGNDGRIHGAPRR